MYNANRVGIVMLPMIFGISRSFMEHARDLERRGYRVRIVDPYATGQTFNKPFFLRLLIRNERKNMADLAERFNDRLVLDAVSRAVVKLATEGCEEVALFGFGMGAVWALMYAEDDATATCGMMQSPLCGVVGWYPHLIFPEGFRKTPPHLRRIKCPIALFYGDRDTKIEPGTVDLALAMKSHPDHINRITIFRFEDEGHAFADSRVQGWWPSPLYRPTAAAASWGAALGHLWEWTKK